MNKLQESRGKKVLDNERPISKSTQATNNELLRY
jgi:hypothetical protein